MLSTQRKKEALLMGGLLPSDATSTESLPCLGRVTASGASWDTRQVQQLALDEAALSAEWQFHALS